MKMNPGEKKEEIRLNRKAASKKVPGQYSPPCDHRNLSHLLIKFSVVYMRGRVF